MLNLNCPIQTGGDPVNVPTTAHDELETALRKVESIEDMSVLNFKDQNNKTSKDDDEGELIVSTGNQNESQDEKTSEILNNGTRQMKRSISHAYSTLTKLSECYEDPNIIKLNLSQAWLVGGIPNADVKDILA